MSTNHAPQKVTLDAELSVALDEALEHAGGFVGSTKYRKWLAQLAVAAVCQAIINNPRALKFPLAVDLRAETEDETNARMMCLHLQEVQP